MCGICGELSYKSSASPQRLEKMLAPLRSRGPDGVGAFVQQRVSLGHRRLSILDLAPTSQQPMVDPVLGVGIVFNGCIYNFRELRAELIAKGFQFFSNGDTEVILKAYAAWDLAASSGFSACLRSRSGNETAGVLCWRAIASASS